MFFLFKKKLVNSTIVIVLILLTNVSYGKFNPNKSKRYFEKAKIAYQSRDNFASEKLIRSALKYDSTNIEAYLLLYDVTSELKQTKDQQWALLKIVSLDSIKYPQAFKFLALNYQNEASFQEAIKSWKSYMNNFNLKDSTLIEEKLAECINAEKLIENKLNVKINRFDSTVNTKYNEYWPLVSFDDSTIYFTRLITNEKKFAFERLFYSNYSEKGWEKAQKLQIGNIEEVNEGTLSITLDGKLFFFTACGRPDGIGSCDIYYIQEKEGIWSKPINAGNYVNTSSWEAQPSVSAFGDVLYWSSNRAGGLGGKDIWMSKIIRDKSNNLEFGKSVNLGNHINTGKDDFSPFIHADDKTLYFSSIGRYGLGKSDLFFSHFSNNEWERAINLGFPINSKYDDDGLVVSPTAHLSVFSSNRDEKYNYSKDIFSIELPDQFCPEAVGYVKGYVYDNSTYKKLNAEIKMANLESNEIYLINADYQDGFIALLKENKLYAFNISKPGYMFYSKHFNLKEAENFNKATSFNIFLKPIEVNDRVVLNNVFFDFDSFKIKEESFIELDRVVNFLKLNPIVKIEISGYTDNQGTEQYNQHLSENRARIIFDYITKYIDSKRISFKGYGANNPIGTNDTEEGRLKNRRSELKITSY